MKILSKNRDQAIELGQKILSAFTRGRAIAHAMAQKRGQDIREAILKLAAQDKAMGRPDRGRPGRIARRLSGLVSQRHVSRILNLWTRS